MTPHLPSLDQGVFELTRDPKMLAGLVAVAALIASVLQLIERDWLRGVTGLVIAATFAITAAGLPERSQSGRWLVYGLLTVVFVLLGIRLLGMMTRTA
jgi:hypothetical protein